MSSGASAVSALPPAGWLFDPYTSQTRWWDGVRWTEHVLPPYEDTEYAATLGIDVGHDQPPDERNGPAHASLVVIAIELLGAIAVLGVVGASGLPWWQFLDLINSLEITSLVLTACAFALAIIGVVTAVRRPTRKREAVLALVLSTLLIAGVLAQTVVSLSASAA
ncbi:DUF2510 domain-containing protein [Microbacterium sp. E-13]|uniref:DUF2510 domain-containing protein n=1 Tax=Microbacterium sp. E-13 TaxID=3404048 RepID=UPI003CF01784